MTFLYPFSALALVGLLLFALVIPYGYARQGRYQEGMTGKKGKAGVYRFNLWLVLLGAALLVLAAMRPVSNPRVVEVEQAGRNIVFAIDVSRSMLAQDLAPNRLDRARFDILNGMDALQGHRVGLVAFAGEAVLKSPLTKDYVYFSQALEDLDVYSVGKGGTNLGDTVRGILEELFDQEAGQGMDILLISDGEDQESRPLEAARLAEQRGVRIVTIGLGDQSRGSPVPDKEGGTLVYQDQAVRSRPDYAILRQMAELSGGWFVPVESGRLPLRGILGDLVKRGRLSTGKAEEYLYDEHYRLFLFPALVCLVWGLMGEFLGPLRRKR